MCFAFQEIGINTTLAIAQNVADSKDKVFQLIETKIGRSPNFDIIPYTCSSFLGRGKNISAFIGVRSFLKRQNEYDYCFVRSPLLGRLALNRGFKVIFESHGSSLHNNTSIFNLFYRKILLKDINSKNFLLFIAISNALANVWINRGVPGKKIKVLHDGVSAGDYKVNKNRYEARKILSIPLEKKVVVYTGSLYKDRGISDIIKLAKIFSEIAFYVVGGPEKEKKYYKSKVLQLGITNIIFVGHIPHSLVKDYLFAADVLLMLWSWDVPTINICSPLKMFEYMAAGRIIVGYAFPTIREVLSDGKTALLANPSSFQELQNKLSLALELNYPNPMAAEARKLALEKYSWQKRASSILRFL